MTIRALGMKRSKMVRMILRFGLTAVLIAIPAISAVAEGGGPVPYPTGSGPTAQR